MTDDLIAQLVEVWCSNPNELHKKPPYRSYSFNNDGLYLVIGSTAVSVLHGMPLTEQQMQ